MKLGPITKLHKKNKTTSKKLDDDIMSENCCIIFPIYNPEAAFTTNSL